MSPFEATYLFTHKYGSLPYVRYTVSVCLSHTKHVDDLNSNYSMAYYIYNGTRMQSTLITADLATADLVTTGHSVGWFWWSPCILRGDEGLFFMVFFFTNFFIYG